MGEETCQAEAGDGRRPRGTATQAGMKRDTAHSEPWTGAVTSHGGRGISWQFPGDDRGKRAF